MLRMMNMMMSIEWDIDDFDKNYILNTIQSILSLAETRGGKTEGWMRRDPQHQSVVKREYTYYIANQSVVKTIQHQVQAQ